MNLYETITNRIIASLEAGVIPWRKEWKASARGTGFPHNKQSGKSYRGINFVSLLCSPYQSSAWLTYKQAAEMGGQVRKGEHGSPVVFWKFIHAAQRAQKAADFILQRSASQFAVVDGVAA